MTSDRSRRGPIAKARFSALVGATIALTPRPSSAAVVLENADPPGVGLNDPTPATPVGGNPGRTRGEQAENALTHAANLWARELPGSLPVRISASFAPLACNAGGGIVGSAVPRTFARDAPGLRPDTWYPIALANHLVGSDLVPSEPDIDARFNGLAGSPGCLEGSPFYLGLDGSPGGSVDLVTTALHEFAHGLGMTTLVDLTTGALHQGSPDIYSVFVFDERLGRAWPDLSDAERTESATRFQQLTFGGPQVTELAQRLLARGVPTLTLGEPLNRTPAIGLSTFGPSLSEAGVAGVVQHVDDALAAPFDGCEAALRMDTRVALVEAGGCDDVTKIRNAQAAGAIAALIVDDRTSAEPLPISGPDPGDITIPALRITEEDAAALRGALPSNVVATLRRDPDRRRGTSLEGRVYLAAPSPVLVGRSVTHWDPSVTPDLLMEGDPRPGHDLDLTVALLRDLGWRASEPDAGVPEAGRMDATPPDAPTTGEDAGAGGTAPTEAGTDGGTPDRADAGGRSEAGPGGSGGSEPPTSGTGGGAAGNRGRTRGGGERGCGCRVGRAPDPAWPPVLFGWVGLALLRRRHRRRSRSR